MNKLFMMDTDICSYIIKKYNDNVVSSYELNLDNCCISAITYGELLFWDLKKGSKKLSESIHALIDNLIIIPLNEDAMRVYAKIRVDLENSGNPQDNMDMLIASCAVSAGAILVSHNKKHFNKIKGLKVENWSNEN